MLRHERRQNHLWWLPLRASLTRCRQHAAPPSTRRKYLELLRKYLVHQARVLTNKERQGIPTIYPLDFSFFKPFQHSLWTEKYEQNLDISRVSMLKPGLLLFYVSKDKWSVSLWCFCVSSFLAKPGAEPRRSGEVIRKYAGGSLKVSEFKCWDVWLFNNLCWSWSDQQGWRWECDGLHNTCDHTACLLGKMTKCWPQYESELCPDDFESKYVAHTTRPCRIESLAFTIAPRGLLLVESTY